MYIPKFRPPFKLFTGKKCTGSKQIRAPRDNRRREERTTKEQNTKNATHETRNTELAVETTYGDEGRDAQVADIALHGHCCWLRSAASVQCRPGDERRRSLNMAFAGGEVKGFKASPPMWRNKGKGHPSSPIGSPLISHGTVYPL